MTILDLITTETLALMVTIGGFLGGAMFWIGVVHNKINSIEKSVSCLMEQTRNLSIEIESHILSINSLEESKGENKKEDSLTPSRSI